MRHIGGLPVLIMTTRQELQEELRKRQINTRIEHEHKRTKHEAELRSEAERISNEQEKLRKQHERLEQDKRHYRRHSFLTRDRRLSLQNDNEKLPVIASPNHQSKSTHTPDYKGVKSRLFEYETVSPRSRLQLIHGMEGSPTPPRIRAPMSSHAFEVNKASYTDIMKNIARLPHGHKASNSMVGQQSRPESETSLPDKELEKKPLSRQNLHSEARVSFKDERERIEAPSPYGLSRRESLQSSRCDTLAPPYLQRRRASLPRSLTESPSPSPQPRRMSMPVSRSKLPMIQTDATSEKAFSDADDNENRLTELYNKAIETVQLADETLLSMDRPAQQRIKIRRQSEGTASVSSGFDLTTLKELEAILSDARSYSKRRNSKEDHIRLDVGTNRAQKKRIDHLEQVLKKLNPSYDTGADIDPTKVLQCSYLRLSHSNIETLENMVRDQGKDPGIHIHMDVSGYDIWAGLKEERTDLPHPEVTEKKHSQKTKKTVQA